MAEFNTFLVKKSLLKLIIVLKREGEIKYVRFI